jgi:hypothetical protein
VVLKRGDKKYSINSMFRTKDDGRFSSNYMLRRRSEEKALIRTNYKIIVCTMAATIYISSQVKFSGCCMRMFKS